MKSLTNYILESKQINLDSDGKEHGFEYVDVGLPSGTMWATYNVGADKPEDPGLLFQFGRVDGYKYGDKNHQFKRTFQNKKEVGCEQIPETTSKKRYHTKQILVPEDDSAHVNMGGKWRMPTRNEIEELINNTAKSVININNTKGMLLLQTLIKKLCLYLLAVSGIVLNMYIDLKENMDIFGVLKYILMAHKMHMKVLMLGPHFFMRIMIVI